MSTQESKAKQMTEGLLRQRRNLLIVSILLPFIISSGAVLKEINLIGTKISIKNPELMTQLLFILSFYFLLRYWQYYNEESVSGMIREEKKEYTYKKEECFLKKKVIEKHSLTGYHNLQITFANYQFSKYMDEKMTPQIKDTYVFPFYKSAIYYLRLDINYHNTDKRKNTTQKQIESFHDLFSNNNDYYPIFYKKNEKIPNYYQGKMHYNLIYIQIFRILGYIKFISSKSYFTDYHLPFFIAISSISLSIYLKVVN